MRRSSTPATSRVSAEQILLKDPEVAGVFSVMGFSFSGAAPNQGLIFASLKPFDQRKGAEHSLQTVLGRVSGQFAAISGANIFAVAPPSIPGLGAFGGFEFQVLDQSGQDINALANATYAMAGAGNQSPKLPRPVHLVHGQRPAAQRRRSIATARWRSDCR